MKKTRLLLGFFLILAVFLFGSMTLFAADAPEKISVVLVDGEGNGTQTVLPEGRTFYLPAQADIKKLTFTWTGDSVTVKGTDGKEQSLASGEALDLSPMLTKDSLGSPCYKVAFGTALYTFYQDKNLPAVFITTEKGLSYIEASKENRDKHTSVLVMAANGKTEYNDEAAGTESELKSRGNATFGYYKKAYQMKLSAKAPLLGMESAKTWILLANYVDQTQLHNALAFHLGDVLNLPFNTQYRHVLLYVDGSFRGIYQLCEKVQIGSGRVEIHELEKDNEKANPDVDFAKKPIVTVKNGALIENSILTSYTYTNGINEPKDITGGYLVELDNVWGQSEPSRFVTENGNIYVVKSPEYVTRSEMEYIAALFADMEEAVYSKDGKNRHGKHFSEYIDMDSFASVYTVEEMMKEWDAYQSSMFFFKDADKDGTVDKIKMGPLWDFDNSLGNLDVDTYAKDPTFLWAQNGKFSNYTRALAAPMMRDKAFSALVAEKFDTVYLAMKSALSANGWFARSVDEIRDAALMDRHRWRIDDPNLWVLTAGGKWKSGTRFVHQASYGDSNSTDPATALGAMRSFLTARMDALLLSIGSGTEPTLPPETTPAVTTAPETTPAATTAPETTAETVAPTETTSPVETTDPKTSIPEGKMPESKVSLLWLAPVIGGLFGLAGALFLLRKRKK